VGPTEILPAKAWQCRFACGLTSCPPTPRPWCVQEASIAPFAGNAPTLSASCDIKGNISVDTGERIYHVPGQMWTRMLNVSAYCAMKA
jgi:hypothetical protein